MSCQFLATIGSSCPSCSSPSPSNSSLSPSPLCWSFQWPLLSSPLWSSSELSLLSNKRTSRTFLFRRTKKYHCMHHLVAHQREKESHCEWKWERGDFFYKRQSNKAEVTSQIPCWWQWRWQQWWPHLMRNGQTQQSNVISSSFFTHYNLEKWIGCYCGHCSTGCHHKFSLLLMLWQ